MSNLNNTSAIALANEVQSLIDERKNWEKAVRATHDQLYHILANCLSIVEVSTLDTIKSVADDLKIGRTARSGAEILVTKLVFGDEDDKRASAYATVLRKAKAAGIKSDDLAAWIADNGGIEKVRTGAADSGNSNKAQPRDKAKDIAKARTTYASMPALTTAPVNPMVHSAAATDEGLVLMVGRRNADGTTAIVTYVTKKPALDQVLATIGADLSGPTAAAEAAPSQKEFVFKQKISSAASAIAAAVNS